MLLVSAIMESRDTLRTMRGANFEQLYFESKFGDVGQGRIVDTSLSVVMLMH